MGKTAYGIGSARDRETGRGQTVHRLWISRAKTDAYGDTGAAAPVP